MWLGRGFARPTAPCGGRPTTWLVHDVGGELTVHLAAQLAVADVPLAPQVVQGRQQHGVVVCHQGGGEQADDTPRPPQPAERPRQRRERRRRGDRGCDVVAGVVPRACSRRQCACVLVVQC